MADEETVVEETEVEEVVEVDQEALDAAEAEAVAERITKLTDAKEGLEVPSYGDDLEDEALAAAIESYDKAMVSYNDQVASYDAELAELQAE